MASRWPEFRVAAMTWDVVAARLAAGAIAVLPVGAGAKQHGLHLPMGTDALQAEHLAGVMARAADALVWPTLTYGYYPAFAAYPGSASLDRGTSKAFASELATALLGQGARGVVVINTGLSTQGPISRAVGHEPRVLHYRAYDSPQFRATVAAVGEQAHGSHADEIETSILLALAPDVVDMARAVASPPGRGLANGPLSPTDPSSPNYSPSGSFGDPTLATAEKGRLLLAALEADSAEAARSFVATLSS